MTVDDLRSFLRVNTDSEVADAIGMSKGIISIWRASEIPITQQTFIAERTNHALKADKTKIPPLEPLLTEGM
ncbi:Cro/Cl family transcriptional regulator [Moraxella osloensis]|uniref:Cro/CI family transcriptional regulator n=1 Tax=Faucicola osloensis TaxID=34062 RepID=UPI002005F22F|nr:Cro/CI family transcriptional regulator [Moraxella osloensis]MCK6158047.1 Cro/Cl family transcriptional regulator [Moraxella osloensis]